MSRQKIIDEYSEEYCHTLELAYGDGMLSEGGDEGIEAMFQHIDLDGKRLLDVGFGLGGVAKYLATNYDVSVRGIEINECMIEEATRCLPENLLERVSFYHYDNEIPFDDDAFDIAYSKSVLCHIKNKKPLFEELYRVIDSGGDLVIIDWLSPVYREWSRRVKEVCDIEDLTLFAETMKSYQALLYEVGFRNIKMVDEGIHYAKYNRQIALSLLDPENKSTRLFREQFTDEQLEDSIAGYRLIAEAIDAGELLVMKIRASKPV